MQLVRLAKSNIGLLSVLVIVCTCVHILPLISVPVDGHDADSHLIWLSDYVRLFGVESWYPRWSVLSLHGFGAPIFYWYPPVTFIIGSILSHVTGVSDASALFKGVAVLGYVASFFSMRVLLRSTTLSKTAILLGSLFYVFNPARYHTLFTRSALPEHMSYAVLPVVFWALKKLHQDKCDHQAFGILAGSLGLLLLTNIPVATTAYVCCFILIAMVLRKQKQIAFILLAAGLLGGLIAAILLLPASVAESQLNASGLWQSVDHSPFMEVIHSGYFLNRLLLPALCLAGITVWWMNRRSQSVGDVRNSDGRLRFIFLTVVLALQLPYVELALQQILLPLQLVQFPWRFYPILMLLIAWYLANAVDRQAVFPASASVLLLASCGLTLVVSCATVFGFRAGDHRVNSGMVRPEYRSKYLKSSDSSFQLMLDRVQVEPRMHSLRSGAIGALQAGSTDYNQRYFIFSEKKDTVVINQYYWPDWAARSRDVELVSWPDSLGRTLIAVPQGANRIAFDLQPNSAARYGGWISMIGLTLTVGMSLELRRRAKIESASNKEQSSEQA